MVTCLLATNGKLAEKNKFPTSGSKNFLPSRNLVLLAANTNPKTSESESGCVYVLAISLVAPVRHRERGFPHLFALSK